MNRILIDSTKAVRSGQTSDTNRTCLVIQKINSNPSQGSQLNEDEVELIIEFATESDEADFQHEVRYL